MTSDESTSIIHVGISVLLRFLCLCSKVPRDKGREWKRGWEETENGKREEKRGEGRGWEKEGKDEREEGKREKRQREGKGETEEGEGRREGGRVRQRKGKRGEREKKGRENDKGKEREVGKERRRE